MLEALTRVLVVEDSSQSHILEEHKDAPETLFLPDHELTDDSHGEGTNVAPQGPSLVAPPDIPLSNVTANSETSTVTGADPR